MRSTQDFSYTENMCITKLVGSNAYTNEYGLSDMKIRKMQMWEKQWLKKWVHKTAHSNPFTEIRSSLCMSKFSQGNLQKESETLNGHTL